MTAKGSRPAEERAGALDGDSYLEILRRHRLNFTRDGPWAEVAGRTAPPRQGWKIHVSSILIHAHEVLERVVPILAARGLGFKITRTPRILNELNSGHMGETQAGKFITVYPPTNEASVEIAGLLAKATRGFRGPRVMTDLKLGDIVYSRYGGFRPLVQRNERGDIKRMIDDPETGELVEDSYEVPYAPTRHPFGPEAVPAYRQEESRALGEALQGKVVLLSQLKTDVKGAVFLGLSLTRKVSVIVKTGRRDYLDDPQGRDMYQRIFHEAAILRHLAGVAGVPAIEDTIESGDLSALIKDYLPGTPLREMTPWPLAKRPRAEWPGVILLARRMTALVEAIHAAGVLHRDLSDGNMIVSDDLTPALIDFELAWRMDSDERPFSLGTEGFMSPQQNTMQRPTPADDVYALGTLILLLFCGVAVRHFHHLKMAPEASFLHRLSRLTALPRDVLRPLAKTVAEAPDERPSLAEIAALLDGMLATLNDMAEVTR